MRWRKKGELEFLGRLDQQVKVRGFRIELDEIESALLEQTGVQQAVVVVRANQAGDKRLVAYVVMDTNARPVAETESQTSHLKTELKRRLPEYMVPAVIIELPELPLTSNGKIDRKALPNPEWQASSRSMLLPEIRQKKNCAKSGNRCWEYRVSVWKTAFLN